MYFKDFFFIISINLYEMIADETTSSYEELRTQCVICYLAYSENWMMQAKVVRVRLGRWNSGFVCNHMLLNISIADVGWTTAVGAISRASITTRAT